MKNIKLLLSLLVLSVGNIVTMQQPFLGSSLEAHIQARRVPQVLKEQMVRGLVENTKMTLDGFFEKLTDPTQRKDLYLIVLNYANRLGNPAIINIVKSFEDKI
ncbi:hypothetical protein M1446_01390 [Candidatus Dependentiae bacterium]|nr:hypothetical protein [Candidatus Dependentiae bacterium]